MSTGDRIRVGKVELIFGTDTQKPAQPKAKRKLDLSILTISPENLSLEARLIDDLIEIVNIYMSEEQNVERIIKRLQMNEHV